MIERDQTGYIKGRYIGENFCPMSDIIEHHGNKEGVILFLDFDKAFDSLEWDYLFKMLDAVNFGLSFLNWIRTFYKTSPVVLSTMATPQIFLYKEE